QWTRLPGPCLSRPRMPRTMQPLQAWWSRGRGPCPPGGAREDRERPPRRGTCRPPASAPPSLRQQVPRGGRGTRHEVRRATTRDAGDIVVHEHAVCAMGRLPAPPEAASRKDHDTGDSHHLPAGPLLTNGVSLLETNLLY